MVQVATVYVLYMYSIVVREMYTKNMTFHGTYSLQCL